MRSSGTKKRWGWAALAIFLIGGMGGVALPARAAPPRYQGVVVRSSFSRLTMEQGKAIGLWIEVRNTGTTNWYKTGSRRVALNVTSPVGRTSVFRHASWSASYRPAVLQQNVVRPGEAGRFRFVLKAPNKPGTYTEHFQIAMRGVAWIDGTDIAVPVTVTPPPPPYRAAVLGVAEQTIVAPGASVPIWADYRNTGRFGWETGVVWNADDVSVFRHASWSALSTVTALGTSVQRKKTVRLSGTLQAPMTPGAYAETFTLRRPDGTVIPGSTATFTVVVQQPDPPPAIAPIPTAQGEPILDVGLRTVTEPVVITAQQPMAVTVDGVAVAHAPADTQITLSYANGVYTATGTDFVVSGPNWHTVTADDAESIVEAVNFENRPAWNTALNDNQFRGSLSLRASSVTGNVWLVNTLPLEHYLRGIAEAGDAAPMEYLKALLTAARSYAHYHIRTNTKHDEEHFTVDATYDQVYRGYNFERRAPNIARAVADTAGMEVTYDGAFVVTPYFANTDGRTRAWEEVWGGGPYAWLVSVPVPEDAGMTLYGHGVGMSGHGALVMAQNGKTHDQILSYFYTGTGLAKQY